MNSRFLRLWFFLIFSGALLPLTGCHEPGPDPASISPINAPSSTAHAADDFTASWQALLAELDGPLPADYNDWPARCAWLLDMGEDIFAQTPSLEPADLRAFYDRFTGSHAAPVWLQKHIAARRTALVLLDPPPDLDATGTRLESLAGDSLALLPHPSPDTLAQLYVLGAHARRSFLTTHEPEWLYYAGLAELAAGNSPRLEWEDYLRMPGVFNRHRLNARNWLATNATAVETLPEHPASADEPAPAASAHHEAN